MKNQKDGSESILSEKRYHPYYLAIFPGSGHEPLSVGDRLVVVEIDEDVEDLHFGKCTSYTLQKEKAI